MTSTLQYQVTDSITLKLLQKQDAPDVIAAIDANRIYLREWLPWVDANTTVADSEAFIEKTHQQLKAGLGLNSAIFYNDTFVGMCGVNGLQQFDNSLCIGYWLSSQYQGKGIVTNCVKFLIEYAFQELQLNKVTTAHAVGNFKSQAVIQRCGFVYEGISRQAEYLYDHYVDHARYSILKSEWPQ